MTPNKRIILNILATYGRSVYSIAVGLFTTRWVLMALGKVDFGLYGLVGGLLMFVSFINGLLSMSVSRFYAVSVGAAKAKSEDDGIGECRRWFNTALFIHTIVPFALIVIGWPIGEWAVCNYLTIPADRITACLWVWRLSCLAGLVSMLNVPFQAMYTAKQEIAELTIYSFATTTLNAFFMYYMVCHPADWLVKYALWMCAMSVTPQLIIALRAVIKYPECRVRFDELYCVARIRAIVKFAAARFWTAFSDIVFQQGQALLVNRFMGPIFNASIRIGVSVSSHAATLSSSMMQAFWPAIGNKAGEGDEEQVRRMTFRVCRFGSLLLMIFAIPLALESRKILELWLENPPEFSHVLCTFVLICMVIGDMTEGYWMAIMGIGRGVGKYSWWVGWSGIAAFAITAVLFYSGLGMMSVCVALLIGKLITLGCRLYLGKELVGLNPKIWLRDVCFPIVATSCIVALVGAIPLVVLEASCLRVVVTTLLCESVLLPMTWYFVLSSEERVFLLSRISVYKNKIRK